MNSSHIFLTLAVCITLVSARDLSCATVSGNTDCPCSCTMTGALTCECASNTLDVKVACANSNVFIKDGSLRCRDPSNTLSWHTFLSALLLTLALAICSGAVWRCFLRPYLFSKSTRGRRVIRKWSFHGEEYFEYGHSDDEEDWQLTAVPRKPKNSSRSQKVVVKTEPIADRPTRVHVKKEVKEEPDLCAKPSRESTALVVDKVALSGRCASSCKTASNYSCQFCGAGFVRASQYHQHVFKHTGVKAFSCKTCGKSFKTKSNLTSHMAVHATVKKHACNQCNKAFARKSDLNRHRKIHLKQRQRKPARPAPSPTPLASSSTSPASPLLPMFVKTELGSPSTIPCSIATDDLLPLLDLDLPPLDAADILLPPALDFDLPLPNSTIADSIATTSDSSSAQQLRKSSDEVFDFHFLRDDNDITADLFNLASDESLFGSSDNSCSSSPFSLPNSPDADVIHQAQQPIFDWSSPDIGALSSSSSSSASLSPFSDGSMSPFNLGGNSPQRQTSCHRFNVGGRMIEWKREEFTSQFKLAALQCKSDSWHVCALLGRPLFDAVAVKTVGSSELRSVSEQCVVEWLNKGNSTCPLTHRPIESVCVDVNARAFVRNQIQSQMV